MSEAWVGGVPAPIVGIVGLPQSVTALGEKPICAFAAVFKSKPISAAAGCGFQENWQETD